MNKTSSDKKDLTELTNKKKISKRTHKKTYNLLYATFNPLSKHFEPNFYVEYTKSLALRNK